MAGGSRPTEAHTLPEAALVAWFVYVTHTYVSRPLGFPLSSRTPPTATPRRMAAAPCPRAVPPLALREPLARPPPKPPMEEVPVTRTEKTCRAPPCWAKNVPTSAVST